MKKPLLISAALILCATIWAQVPQGISHQAVIRNAQGELVTNQLIGIQVSIIEDSINGKPVYRETHTATTNVHGLVTYVIGEGDPREGSFDEIKWDNWPFFLMTEVDPDYDGDEFNFTIIGTTQFLSVPYALYSGASADNHWMKQGNNIFSRNTGNVGIGTTNPQAKLHTTGSVRFAGAGTPGAGKVLTSNAVGTATWQEVPFSSNWSVSDSDIYRLDGNVGIGTQTPLALLHSLGDGTGEGNVLFEGVFKTDDNPGDPPTTGPGTRMMWYPDMAAFRAGSVLETHWDKDSIGIYSFATGINTVAKGQVSTAMGSSTTASGDASTAMGDYTIASGLFSTAMGHNTTASGAYTTAMGVSTTASGFMSTAMGYSTIASGNSSTAMGSGARAIGNYSFAIHLGYTTGPEVPAYTFHISGATNTIISNGNVGIGTSTPEAQLHTTGSVRFEGAGTPAAGKVLTSDENGVASWQAESDPSVPIGTQVGEMQYWDGTAWVTVSPGSTGNVLTLINGVPTWGAPGMGMGANDVYNPATGKIWMDRNLGATQVATSSTDAAAYGHLYQWGRGNDGHQIRTSGITSTLSSSDTPGHGDFITVTISPWDWRSPQNDNLWQGVNGVNNPCPAGYRLPTEAEWNAERLSWSTNNAAGAFASPLKLPVAGFRLPSSGSLDLVGAYGDYWSSTVGGTGSRLLYFSSSGAYVSSSRRAYGRSVRCLKD